MSWPIKKAVSQIAELIKAGEPAGRAVAIAYEENNLDNMVEKSILVDEFKRRYKMLPFEYKQKVTGGEPIVIGAVGASEADQDDDDEGDSVDQLISKDDYDLTKAFGSMDFEVEEE